MHFEESTQVLHLFGAFLDWRILKGRNVHSGIRMLYILDYFRGCCIFSILEVYMLLWGDRARKGSHALGLFENWKPPSPMIYHNLGAMKD